MCAASAVLLASFLALSASFPNMVFRYDLLHSIRRSTDTCRVCYGDDCVNMGEARCEYYAEADDMMEKDDEAGDVSVVDEMMSDLTQEAVMSWTVHKCIPFISYYTNCNKENICVGCKTCYCQESGDWSCELVQRCRSPGDTRVDHRTLATVIQKLYDVSVEVKKRKKRLVKQLTNKSEMEQVSLMDVAEWTYETKPNTDLQQIKPTTIHSYDTVMENKTNNTESSSLFGTDSSTTIENEYLGFEEVLKNIAIEDHKRRKSQMKENTYNGYDNNIDLGKHRIDDENCTGQFLNALNAIEEGRDVTEPTGDTTFVVDLFPHANTNDFDDKNVTENVDSNDIYNIIYEEENNTNNISNNRIESANRIKRDTHLNDATQDDNLTTVTLETTTNKENDLKNHVLLPLTNIIDDKQNEVKELLHIKENLLRIMNIYYNDTQLKFTKNIQNISGSTYLSIYNMDLFPEIQENIRKNNLNLLDKMLNKLKRDIIEVLRDVAGIQKISTTHGLPDDLNMLIRSMKYYINKHGSIRNFKRKDIQLERINDDTRKSQVMSVESKTSKSIKRQLIDILEVLDKDTSQSSNALINLSKFPKKIIKRVIKQNIVAESSVVDLKIADNEYNLTTDLRTIGRAWPQMINYIAKSPPHEKIYAMKLLHLSIASDIIKISDAISLIDFAYGRRMSPIEIPVAEEMLERINSGLTSMKNKLEIIIHHQTTLEKKILQKNVQILRKQNKKQSFLKRLKNFLKNSKKRITSLTKKKTPKLDTLAEDEQTMVNWQANLDIPQRKKRNLSPHVSGIKNRMKNIIPKYLRGKLRPAIEKNKRNIATTKKKTSRHNYNATTKGALISGVTKQYKSA